MIRRVVSSSYVLLVAACAWGDFVGPATLAETARVHVGDNFACALGADRQVRCWGTNGFGQLGNGQLGRRSTPSIVTGDLLFQSFGVHGAGQHACAVTIDAVAYCWGENHFGQLGDGSFTHRAEPVPVRGEFRFRSISAGWRFSCGVTIDFEALCWGRGEWGQLGDGEASRSVAPVAVAGELRFAAVEAGSNSLACGITVGGALYCWGLDRSGSIGTPTTETCTGENGRSLPCARTPMRVAPELEFRDVAVGLSFACAVTLDDILYCWGRNTVGQIGVPASATCGALGAAPTHPCNPTPSPVLTNISSVSAGSAHTCAIAESGSALCWGQNRYGEIGDGQLATISATPRRVAGGLVFESISAGVAHTCGNTTDGATYCWGLNDLGQIGDGTMHLALTPSRVPGATGPF